jgi:hypothetical protein
LITSALMRKRERVNCRSRLAPAAVPMLPCARHDSMITCWPHVSKFHTEDARMAPVPPGGRHTTHASKTILREAGVASARMSAARHGRLPG